jgi:uncharacterized protein YjdB
MSSHLSKLACTLLVAALCACGGGGGGDASAPGQTTIPPTTTLSLGSDQAIPKGLAHTFTATASRSDGATRDCTGDAVWGSSNPAIASVDAGVASGLAVGTATITATCDGAQASVQLVVTAAELVSMDVSASDAAIPVGADTRFTATGTYTDGSTADLTAAVAWSSLDPAITTISGDPGLEGVATGIGQGTATVRADAAGGIFGTASLQVTDAVLTSVAVAQIAPLALGLAAPLAAAGTYSDGTVHDLTDTVTWTSADPSIVTVSNTAGTQGLAAGVGQGTTTVTATSAAGPAGEVSVTVTAAQLLLVEVAPIDPAIVAGSTLALAATGTYSDDGTADLTATVTWSSSDPAVSVTSGGVATGVAAGSATVTATDLATGLSGSILVTVSAPTAAPALSYLSLSRGSIVGGGSVTGTVVLTEPAAADLIVALSSSGANATVPAEVVIPAGSTSATFTVATTAPAKRKVRVTIGASYDGVTKTATLNVRRP